jgi:hypothetical protein
MSDSWTLEELDQDGAIREAAEKVDPDTRAAFLKKAGVGLGAVAGSGAFLGAVMPSIASAAAAPIPASDIDILNFALTLEYLEAAFYGQAVAGKQLSGETKRFATVVSQHEHAHVAFLKKVLGSKAVAEPTFDFKDTTTNQVKFQATAQLLEDTGVHAYLGQVKNITSKAVLEGAGRILPVEARHAAWIRDLRFHGGKTPPTTPAPAALEDDFFTKAQILAAVKKTGFIVS